MNNIENKINGLFDSARKEQNLVSISEARSLIENTDLPGGESINSVKHSKRFKKMNIISISIIAAAISAWLTIGIFGSADKAQPDAGGNSNAVHSSINEPSADNSEHKENVTSGNSEEGSMNNKVPGIAKIEDTHIVPEDKHFAKTEQIKPEKLQSIELTLDELKEMGITITQKGSLNFTAFSDSKSPVGIMLNENDVAANFISDGKVNTKCITPVFITDGNGNRILSLFKSSDGRNFLSYQKEINEEDLKNEKYLKKNDIRQIKAEVKIDIDKHKELINSKLADKEINLAEIEDLVKTIVEETMTSIDGKVIRNKKFVSTLKFDTLNLAKPNLDSILRSLNLESDFSRNGRKAKIYIRSKVNNETNEEELEINNYPDSAGNNRENYDIDIRNLFNTSADSSLSFYFRPDTNMKNLKFNMNPGNLCDYDSVKHKLNWHFEIPDSLCWKNWKDLKMPNPDSMIKFYNGRLNFKMNGKKIDIPFPDSTFKQYYNDLKFKIPGMDSVQILLNKSGLMNNGCFIDSINCNLKNIITNFDSLNKNTTNKSIFMMKQFDGTQLISPDKKVELNMMVHSDEDLPVMIESIKDAQAEFDQYTKVNKFVAISVSDINNPDFRYILWFEPTLDFIETMPSQFRDKLIKEYNASKTEEICNNPAIAGEETYFDIWKSCSGAIENLSVFPNPVNTLLNMKFKLTEARFISIALHDLSGNTILNYRNNFNYQAGDFTEAIKADSLEPGMYILSVQSDKGEKALQRFIVE